MDRIQRFFENLWERTKRWFRNPTRRNLTIGVILLLIASLMLGVPSPHVSLAAEPIFPNRFPWFTNALLTTLFVDLILIALALAARAQLKEIPSGFGNFMEFIVEGLFNLTESVAGRNARKFFPWAATIFLFVIISNYSGLIPGVGSIGLTFDEAHGEVSAVEEAAEDVIIIGEAEVVGDESVVEDVTVLEEGEEGEVAELLGEEETGTADIGAGEDEVVETEREEVAVEEAEEHVGAFVPLFRSPSADLNMTIALALVTMFMVQYFGYQALGGGYFSRFFNWTTGTGVTRGMFFFSGILELISEFAKIISFAFRLFGNIFAGEVLLVVMAFLVAFLVPIPFYGLEVFVGFIQALVFMMLAVVFFSTAIISHGGHDDHH